MVTAKKITIAIAMVLVMTAAIAWFLWPKPERYDYGFAREVNQQEQALRLSFVQKAESWLGSDEGSQEHKEILSIYNGHTPLAQGYLVQENDNWCATFVSTVAIELGLTDIIPTECGCQRQIGLFQKIACWEEDDGYIPLPGDIIYYCNSDKDPFSDCTGWSDHVGIVVGTAKGYIKVIEGNSSNTVAYRYIQLDSRGIRGFALPDYEGYLASLEDV